MSDLRSLPSVDKLLQTDLADEYILKYGRPLVLRAVRRTLALIREGYPEVNALPEQEDILKHVGKRLENWIIATLIPVINATGVIIHTNLGRAPLSKSSIQAMGDVARGYSNLEYELEKGRRGSRLHHTEAYLKLLTNAEAAMVVNNNASAVLLILSALARRRRVLIARSQLIEIGGGFRIPEVMKQSGAKLVEIGTTNRIHLSDYEEALAEQPIYLVMRAHRSNFAIIGFTTEPPLEDIASVAHAAGVPLLDDLGSGSLLDTSKFGLESEPMVQESVASGADLVCFSGDKLLGGPQAGIIVGKSELIAKLKRHPLARAIRADKLCLAGLSATLSHYLKNEAVREIPVWQMISTPLEKLRERAQFWEQKIGKGQVMEGKSTVGGGSLPGETLPTTLYALECDHPNRLLERLRDSTPPIIARISEDRVVLDPRTVLPEQDNGLLTGVKSALNTMIS
jgi:L-seryl-tRNA(Ser) seleniumtransferase